MSSWADLKQTYQQRYEKITDYMQNQLPKDIQTLSDATAKYIAKGGISQDPTQDADYNTAQQTATTIQKNRQDFQQLNSDISKSIQQLSSSNDMGKLLLENGVLQQINQALDKEKGLIEVDVKSAELRDELLRSQESNVTKHQLFLLGRPLRPSSIPYLWALSVLFIGTSLIIFQQMAPPITPLFANAGAEGSFAMYLADPRIWGTLSGALAIVVIFLSLKIANVI